MKVLDQALEAAHTFKPLSGEAVAALLARTADRRRTAGMNCLRQAIITTGRRTIPNGRMRRRCRSTKTRILKEEFYGIN